MNSSRIVFTSSRWPLIGRLRTAWANERQPGHESSAHDCANLRKSTMRANLRQVSPR